MLVEVTDSLSDRTLTPEWPVVRVVPVSITMPLATEREKRMGRKKHNHSALSRRPTRQLRLRWLSIEPTVTFLTGVSALTASGFGREWAHAGSGMEPDYPMISCDYLYITASGVFLRTELGEEERDGALRVLVFILSDIQEHVCACCPLEGCRP